MKRNYWIALLVALSAVGLVLTSAACSSEPQQQGYPYGGSGMMGPGMMGGGVYSPDAQPISIHEAAESVHRYLNAYGGGLEVAEVMEFAWNFYAEVEEKETGIHAMELLIDKYTGQVYPEMGPNMRVRLSSAILLGGRSWKKKVASV